MIQASLVGRIILIRRARVYRRVMDRDNVPNLPGSSSTGSLHSE
jgi:hypothetical protein